MPLKTTAGQFVHPLLLYWITNFFKITANPTTPEIAAR
jgi:hypothetical protein